MTGCEEVTSAVILAGGDNRRFGALKSFINIEGAPLITRNLALFNGLFDEVFISTNDPEPYFRLDSCRGTALIGDVLPSRGPMSGIYSALLNVKGQGIFVSACDMPFLNEEMITFIRGRHVLYCREKGPCDAVVPVFNNEPQSLLAIYTRTLLQRLEDCIVNDKTDMIPFLREVCTCFIDEADVRKIDPEGRSFVNINTAEDLKAYGLQR